MARRFGGLGFGQGAKHQLAQDWPDGCPTRKQYDAGWKPGDPITAALANALNSQQEENEKSPDARFVAVVATY